VRIEFGEPMSAVAPGQAAVFSAGDVVLGGGILVRMSGEEDSASGANALDARRPATVIA
jgi:tRNA U34 2-thiouridine synthase MnmA/TrmU